MTFLNIFIATGIAVIGLVVYSALVISGRQERLAQRIREENGFEKVPCPTYSAGGFAFETSEDLTTGDDILSEIDEIGEIVFNFKKIDS